jgi:predicted MFS family arabinose efflux permease
MPTEQDVLQAPGATLTAATTNPTQDAVSKFGSASTSLDEDPAAAERKETERPQLTRWVALIGAAVFATTMSQTGILRLPFQNLLKSELNVSREGMASFFALTAFAWYFKPLAGILTDSVPLFGTRRRYYLVLSALCAGGFYFLAGVVSHTYLALMIVLVAANAMLVIGSTVAGGLTVEAGQRYGATGRLSSAMYLVANGCVLLGGPLGGFLAAKAFGFTAATCALISLSVVPFAWWLVAEPVTEQKRNETWAKAKAQFSWLVRSRTMWTTAGLLFLVYIAPGFSTPLYYLQTDTLKFSQQFIGTLILFGGMFGIGGSLLYAFLCPRLTLRVVLYVSVIASALGSLGYLFYRSAIAASVVESENGLVAAFVTLALMDLAARATPRGSEALGFALMMSILNIAQSLSDVFGSWLMDHHHVSFFRLVWLNAGTTALVLLAIPLLPAALIYSRDATDISRTSMRY